MSKDYNPKLLWFVCFRDSAMAWRINDKARMSVHVYECEGGVYFIYTYSVTLSGFFFFFFCMRMLSKSVFNKILNLWMDSLIAVWVATL